MSKEIRNFLAIFALPMAVISLVMVFIAPAIVAQAILGMLTGASIIVIGMAFLIEHLDKKA